MEIGIVFPRLDLKMSASNFLHKKTLCVVTGASRGIGRSLAVNLASELADNSALLIVARNADGLQRTANDVRAKNPAVHVETLTLDLTHFSVHSSAFDNAMINIYRWGTNFELALLIHNAATLGPIDRRVDQFFEASEIRDYMEMNFVSFVLLNNAFLRALPESTETKLVVNITSLSAIKGLPGMGIYSAGKAAREGFMRALAVEKPDLRVLNYAPGPVDTDMVKTVAQETWHDQLRNDCQERSGNFVTLTCEQTTGRLLKILNENVFENGTRIDYFD